MVTKQIREGSLGVPCLQRTGGGLHTSHRFDDCDCTTEKASTVGSAFGPDPKRVRLQACACTPSCGWDSATTPCSVPTWWHRLVSRLGARLVARLGDRDECSCNGHATTPDCRVHIERPPSLELRRPSLPLRLRRNARSALLSDILVLHTWKTGGLLGRGTRGVAETLRQ